MGSLIGEDRMKIVGIIILGLMLSGCAAVAVGGAAGYGVYRYNKCERWVDTSFGPRKVWVCKHYIGG